MFVEQVCTGTDVFRPVRAESAHGKSHLATRGPNPSPEPTNPRTHAIAACGAGSGHDLGVGRGHGAAIEVGRQRREWRRHLSSRGFVLGVVALQTSGGEEVGLAARTRFENAGNACVCAVSDQWMCQAREHVVDIYCI